MKNTGVNLKEFNINEHLKEKIYCIEAVTNNDEEITIDTMVYEDKKNRNDFVDFYNHYNCDDRYKYIAVDYYINEKGEFEIC